MNAGNRLKKLMHYHPNGRPTDMATFSKDQVSPTVLPYFCTEARNPQDFSAGSKQPNSAHGVLKVALWADAVLCARRRLGWRPVNCGSGTMSGTCAPYLADNAISGQLA